jgi:4-hydroxy-tetrahydrodipicolinate synthase
MQKDKCVFFGCATALVTPFKNGEVDYLSLGRLIDFQIENGADAIVVLGTTGEAPTINETERAKIIELSSMRINGRVPLIVGVGTNSTESTIRYAKNAHSLGANAILAVTPYYNKPNERGLIYHYKSLASAVDLPIILYNVPSRTGLNMPLDAYEALSDTENIVGIKEASGNASYLVDLVARVGGRYSIYTGNDDLAYSTLSLGGDGVISVVSNLYPRKMHELCLKFKKGEMQNSLKIQLELLPLIRELFKETNPVPVKCALSILGYIENELRLPLAPSLRENQIKAILNQLS